MFVGLEVRTLSLTVYAYLDLPLAAVRAKAGGPPGLRSSLLPHRDL